MYGYTKSSYNRLVNALKDAYDGQCRVSFNFMIDMLGPYDSAFTLEGNITEIQEEEGYKDEDNVIIYLGDSFYSRRSHGIMKISSKSGLFERAENDYLSYRITYMSDYINNIMQPFISKDPSLQGMQYIGSLYIKIWSAALSDNE